MNLLTRAKNFMNTAARGLGDNLGLSSPQHSAKYFNSPGSGGAAALFGWRPALREARDDVAASYTDAAARAIDTLHNSGWMAGAVDQAIARTIGSGLRLSPRPDRISLGWDEAKTEAWASLVERRYILRAGNPLECDAAGKHTIGELTAQFLKIWFAFGEGVALLPSIQREGSLGRSKIQMIMPHRLVQDRDDLSNMFQGVRMDAFGFPLSYRFKQGDRTSDIAARDNAGRPQVVHLFQGMPGQVRGISPMAPVFRVLRQYDQLADATLTAALLQTVFAATVESEAPTQDFLAALQDPGEQEGAMETLFGFKNAWYQQTKVDLGVGGRIAHLFPGEKLSFNKSEHPNETYEAFSRFLLRETSRCIGLTFEEFTGDYNGVTYTGARLGTSANWPIILQRRALCARFLQADYEAWLEEEIEAGFIPFDGGIMGFMAQRQAACSADWRGPAKPQADDLKTAKAHEVYKRLGIASDEMICDDLGVDWEDVYEQRAREQARREQLGLPDGDTLEVDLVGDALVTQKEGQTVDD